MHRYDIQIKFLNDEEPRWSHFHRAESKATLRNARKEWWHWANYEWNDAHRLPIFRIYDAKARKPVE